MGTSAVFTNAPRSRRRFPKALGVISVVIIAALVASQIGIWNPATMLDRIPSEYIPDTIERRLDRSSSLPESAILPGAYLYQQQRPLSCEYASTQIAASMVGWNISEYDFDAVVPLNENPHYGYRGNIWGEWGNTTDYGIYAEPLHHALSSWGVPSSVFYAQGNDKVLRQELAQGRPVVVWLAMQGAINSFDVQGADGETYQLTQYMHVMTAYGFDHEGVVLTDPGTAVWRFYDWQTFMTMWNVMDGMGLSIHPAAISAESDTFFALRRYRQ